MKKKLQIAHFVGCLVAVILIGMGAHAIFGSGVVAVVVGGIAVILIGLAFRKEIAQWTAARPDAIEEPKAEADIAS